MKVLFTLDTLRGGGTESSLLLMLSHFNKDIESTVCSFYEPQDLHEAYEKVSCNLVYLKLPGRYSFAKGIRKLLVLVRKEKYDVIVTSLYRASIMSRIVGWMTGIPVIDTMVNDSYGNEKLKEFNGVHRLKFLFVYLLDRGTSFIPKKWIGNSVFLSEQLGRQLSIPDSRIEVLYRGRSVTEISAWVKPLNEHFQFIAIGRLFGQKAHADLLQAFAIVNRKFPNTRLVIYGEGPLKEMLEKLVSSLKLSNSVVLAGRVHGAWRELYKANCFVLPSRYEGFSGALVEALLSGIPVIASDIPMNKEAVRHRVNGLLHCVNDIPDLVLKMEEVIMQEMEAIMRGKQARQEAMKRYDIRIITAAYEQIMKRVVQKETKA